MKIAIQGHPTRGKEVIQILESLGGKNNALFKGVKDFWYFIDSDGHIRNDYQIVLIHAGFKTYTLEEFEKEFPFKVGDKVTFKDDDYPYTIKAFDIWSDGDIVCEFVENGFHYSINKIKLYKEMKEKRNITLTLDKAKEWYKKGGELKEIALQAFTEKELNPLPRSWEEYCMTHGCVCLSARYTNISTKYDALIKLEQLRDCWRQGWIPKTHEPVYTIKFSVNGLSVYLFNSRAFLSFPTKEMAEEFLKCFRDLIEQAGDLI